MQASSNPLIQTFQAMLYVECARCAAPSGQPCGKLSEATGEWVKRRHGVHLCRMERFHALARARTARRQSELWPTKPEQPAKARAKAKAKPLLPEQVTAMLGAVGAGPIAAEDFFIAAQVGIAPFRRAVEEGLLVTRRTRGVCYIQLASWAAPKRSPVIPRTEPEPPTAAEEVGLHGPPDGWTKGPATEAWLAYSGHAPSAE